MAMVASERKGYSIGAGKYTNGFDPSNSSIANPVSDLDGWYRAYRGNGFSPFTIDPKVAELENALKVAGPLILTHYAKGFPYGPRRKPVSYPNVTHAVVITGIDTDAHSCWMNNPWGDLDEPIQISAVIYSIKRWIAAAAHPLAAYEG